MNSAAKKSGPGNVESIRVFDDASGAPAVVSYGAYRFAFDTLGEVKANLLRPVYGSRVANRVALDVCTRAYLSARGVSLEWLERNARMYEVAS